MARLLPLSARKVIKILADHGFRIEMQRGSHIKLKRHEGDCIRTVIVPNYPEIGPMVLNSIIRQPGLARELFCG